MTKIKMTKRIVKSKRDALLSCIGEEELVLSNLASALLNKVVVPYLNQAWFIFMPRNVYNNRVFVLNNLIKTICESTKQQSDDDLVRALHDASTQIVQPRTLQRLLDNVLLDLAKGNVVITSQDAKGKQIKIEGGILGLSEYLTATINVLNATQGKNAAATTALSDQSSLSRRIALLENDVARQKVLITKQAALLKKYEKILERVAQPAGSDLELGEIDKRVDEELSLKVTHSKG